MPSRLLTRREGIMIFAVYLLFLLAASWALWLVHPLLCIGALALLIYPSALYYRKVCMFCPQVNCPVNPGFLTPQDPPAHHP